MTLNQLRVLQAVADAGGLKAAAGRLNRSISAVSMILRQLEHVAGGAIFEGDRKANLTPLGRYILDEARGLLEHYERVSHAVRAYAKGGPGRLEIACVPSVAAAFMPGALAALWSVQPLASVNMRDMDSRSVAEAVALGTVELGLASFTTPNGVLHASKLFTDPLDVVCSSKDKLAASGRPVTWEDLASLRFISNGSYSSLSSPSFAAIHLRSVASIPNVISLLAAVRARLGITILPRLLRMSAGPDLAFLPLADPDARRAVSIISRANRPLSPIAASLVVLLHQAVAARQAELELSRSNEVPGAA